MKKRDDKGSQTVKKAAALGISVWLAFQPLVSTAQTSDNNNKPKEKKTIVYNGKKCKFLHFIEFAERLIVKGEYDQCFDVINHLKEKGYKEKAFEISKHAVQGLRCDDKVNKDIYLFYVKGCKKRKMFEEAAIIYLRLDMNEKASECFKKGMGKLDKKLNKYLGE